MGVIYRLVIAKLTYIVNFNGDFSNQQTFHCHTQYANNYTIYNDMLSLPDLLLHILYLAEGGWGAYSNLE
jgi:hypothetical protein